MPVISVTKHNENPTCFDMSDFFKRELRYVELVIAIIGAIISIAVAILGAILSLRSNIVLKNRTLKESYYTRYIDALHDLASKNTSTKMLTDYVKARDELLIIANEQVITALLLYEEKAVGKQCDRHDEYLTSLITAIRKDLKLKDKNFPMIRLVK